MFSIASLSRILTLLLSVAVWSGGVLDARAAEDRTDPSNVYLQAFMLLREVRSLEAEGRFGEAAWKCRKASEMYDSIVRRWPAWQADMVDSRRQKVRKQYLRLKKRADEQRQPDPGLGPNSPGDASWERSLANGDDGLPQRGGQGSLGGEVGLPKLDKPDGVASLPRSATPRERFQRLEREVERLRNDRARLIRQMQDQVDNTAAANRNLGMEREKVAELRNRLAEAENALSRLEGTGVVAIKSQVDELRSQLALATERLREQNEKTQELVGAYEASQKSIAELTMLAEDLTQQRDEMAAIIKGLQTEEGTLDLITENAHLRELLNATQARVDELEFEKIEDQEEIARLRAEVSQLREELAQVKAENEAYKQRMLTLQDSLEDAGEELARDAGTPGADEGLRHENVLLRQIIQRQLRQQAFRQQKREAYLTELQVLESGSDDLIAKINELAEEAPLSEEERALIGGNASLAPAAGDVSGTAPGVGGGEWDQRLRRFAEAAAYNFGLGRFENAAAHYEEILTFSPQDVETLCNLGVTRIRLNQVKEARGLFDRAILADAESARAHFMHGVACFHLDDTEAAVASIRKAVEMEPDNAELRSFLGVVHVVRAEWDDAVDALGMAVDLDPRQAAAHYNLSYAILNSGHNDARRALKHYHLALKHGLSPNERMESYFRKLQSLPVDEPSAVSSSTSSAPAS